MNEKIIVILELIALLLIAAGVTAYTWDFIGAASLAVGGVVVGIGSQVAAWINRKE